MASFVAQCFSNCFFGGAEDSFARVAGKARSANLNDVAPQPHVLDVTLDTSAMGQEAVVVKNSSRLCGTGAARATTAIHQNKAYWEVKVQQDGVWGCGLANSNCDMNKALGKDGNSWVITSENVIKNNDHVEYRLETSSHVQEGDVLGFTYDHVELNFFLNGVNLNFPILGIKGTVYPILFVDDGAILDSIFESFRNDIPTGFDKIMIEQALL